MNRGRGLYEALLSEALARDLEGLAAELEADCAPLHPAEAPDRIALHIGRVLERAIAKLDRQERVTIGAELARRLVDIIVEATSTDALTAERPIDPAKVLHSVIARLPDGSREALPAPLAVKVTVDGRALTKSDAFEYK